MMGWQSADERTAYLRRYFDLYEKSRFQPSPENNTGVVQGGASPTEQGDLLHTLAAMQEEYEAHVPVLPLSRCPFTGRVVYHSIDPYGIDGLWWSYESPVRPVESLPSRYLAFSGAMKIVLPVEYSPFVCKPGPGSPFVLPRILKNERVRAVISTLTVGRHRGFPVFYFADPVQGGTGVTNDWGMSFWQQYDPDNTPGWVAVTENEAEYDFDLEPWVLSGKILWIAPGDRTLTLRTGLADCPFTSLGGEEKNQRIQYGKVWTS
jgi:hypothetical protein